MLREILFDSHVWFGAHNRLDAFFGDCPGLLVPICMLFRQYFLSGPRDSHEH